MAGSPGGFLRGLFLDSPVPDFVELMDKLWKQVGCQLPCLLVPCCSCSRRGFLVTVWQGLCVMSERSCSRG